MQNHTLGTVSLVLPTYPIVYSFIPSTKSNDCQLMLEVFGRVRQSESGINAKEDEVPAPKRCIYFALYPGLVYSVLYPYFPCLKERSVGLKMLRQRERQ